MSASRSDRSRRSLTFISTLLLSTALAAPAFAQIEEVVVTAQKRAEDIQTVPIAVTAFSAQDLATKQIQSFDDLQYNVPNVTYARSNFGGGADFQIRGIGVTAIGYDAEAGVAVVVDNVFLESPPLANAAFYDLSDVEVLAGPQSTLYGRGAVGGVINITTQAPTLDEGSASLMGSYGNYNAKEVQGTVDLPIITDQLAVRIAGDWIDHGGYVTNIYNNSHPDDEDEYSVRGSARWEPTSHTTIDVTGSVSNENDNAMRSTKQLCTTDITGVLGCLPTSAGTQPVNINSNLSTIASSQQGFENAFAGSPLAGIAPFVGLYNILTAPAVPAGYVDPSSPRQINTDFNPTYHAHDEFLSGEWKQTNILPWLDADLVLGYDHDSVLSQESYNNVPGEPLPRNTNTTNTGIPVFPVNQANCYASALGAPNLDCAEYAFLGTLAGAGGAAYAANYYPYFAVPGELPISSTKNNGIVGGAYSYTPNAEAFDQSDGEADQYSAELRFDTHFSGPLNFRVGGYYLHERSTGDYYVNASTLDYPAIIIGGLSGLGAPSLCGATGCVLDTPFYHNDGTLNTLTDKAVYGEVYFDAIPDTLKFTGGLRYSEDDKYQVGRISLYSGLAPIGSSNENAALATLVAEGLADFDASKPGGQVYQINSVSFTEYTGHLTADWTPKLDFTDQTLVYATYSRGYKAGGFNPGIEPGLSISPTYAPEFIDDYELGTKNMVLNDTLQLNGDIWYYNYTGLQVSEINNNTSINQNVNAKLYGAEGEFVWAATDQLQFSLNIAETHTGIGNVSEVDARNPTGGNTKAVLIKDDTISASTGENCVLYYTGAGTAPSPASLGIPGYSNPYGGPNADASAGIATANYGPCNPTAAQVSALNAAGFYTGWYSTAVGGGTPVGVAPGPVPGTKVFQDGAEVSLKGDELQNTPDFDTTIGAQWTQPVGGDYNLVAHVDYYWQSHMWGRIFEDGADRINSFGNMNATLTLNAPDNKWFVQAFIKNVFGSNYIEGEYLTSPTSGLYTNSTYGDPRTYGLKVGIKL